MTDLPLILSVFLVRMAGGYALCLAAIGPSVREGSWRRVSSFVIAGLCAVAAGAGAPPAPTLLLGAGALVFERAHTFGVRGLSWPVWLAPLALGALLAREWPPRLDTIPSAIAIGGTLGAMLLGHSHLTARGLGFGPLRRMAWVLFAVLCLRAVSVVPAWFGPDIVMMDYVFLSLRCALGLALPLAMAWMVIQCIRIESNQSATGILYAMTVLVGVFGELVAVYLRTTRGIPA